MFRRYTFLLILIAFMSACADKSKLQLGETTSSSSSLDTFSCTPESLVGQTDIQRLTKYELENTIKDIFGATVHSEVSSQIAAIPEENSVVLFDTIERSISSNFVQAYFDLAVAIPLKVTANDSRISSFAGSCFLAATVTNNCLENFIKQMGLKIFRRPVSSDELVNLKDFFKANLSTNKEALQMLLSDMLLAPDFLYRLDYLGSQDQDGILQLTSYELASRLSYTVTGSTPDSTLLQAASSGKLDSQDGLKEEFKRLVATPRAKEHVKYFYRQWLEINKPISLTYSSQFLEGANTNKFVENSEKELEDFVDYIIWNKKGNVSELITSNESFVTSTNIANLYGVAPWKVGEPPVLLNPQERSGLLTRIRYLASGDDDTHPFRRGSRVLSGFMCYNPPRPDSDNLPEDALVEPPFDPHLSTRHRFEKKTLEPMCMSCHSKINPMAFALENIDSLGRYRENEKIYDHESGTITSIVPVDSNVTYTFNGIGTRSIRGPVQLSRELAESGDVDSCFVRQWYRFSRGKVDTRQDHCSLSKMLAALKSENGSILDVIEASVMDPAFRLRRTR